MSNPNRQPIPLYVPKVLNNDEPVFVMSATHRGDMYHLRAAMQLQSSKYSLVLYNSTPETKDLETYLTLSVLANNKHIFIVPWTYEELNAKQSPQCFDNCFLDEQPYDGKDSDGTVITRHNLVKFGETDATLFVSKEKSLPPAVRDGMAVISKASKNSLAPKFKTLLEETWGINPGQSAIVVMYRDTGTSKTMGVYPELDSGTPEEIDAIVSELPQKGSDRLKVLSCGYPSPKKGTGIGEYWLELKKLPEATHENPRDLEAYFLKWAYDNGYYKMASGFRSGALDLFTFMGIPTVSLGLRNMVGEDRHELLAAERFQRVNIQYDQPRHNTTAYIKHIRDTPKKILRPLLGSPFWGGEKESQPPNDALSTRAKPTSKEDKKTQQTKNPQPFAPFDNIVVEIGYRVACHKYIEWPESIKSMKDSFPDIIDTHIARFCYPDEASKMQYLKNSKSLDIDDIKAMENKLKDAAHTLQQPQGVFDEYRTASETDWTNVDFLMGCQDAFELDN
ncbi:hypothetical protein EDB81DRAFT_908015 [Dactylonectria macrodidyma]|uniref:Uncharacterized protein n=1 Tax=Dactylonectria macrodidyma TaxID=307937 RepID=A0A9P9E090_9HYPO|nr:hypothetical protein EDB81DRAFT_908015 [Dactylonectria macrodidyma]